MERQKKYVSNRVKFMIRLLYTHKSPELNLEFIYSLVFYPDDNISSFTKLFVFHSVLMPLAETWIHLFYYQLRVTGSKDGRRKTLNLNQMYSA